MHKAAAGGHLEMIKFLSPMFGARVHEKTNTYYTMLHWAAQEGHCEVAQYLIEELKMDPQDRDKVCGCQGRGRSVPKYMVCMDVCYDKPDHVPFFCCLNNLMCCGNRGKDYTVKTLYSGHHWDPAGCPL